MWDSAGSVVRAVRFSGAKAVWGDRFRFVCSSGVLASWRNVRIYRAHTVHCKSRLTGERDLAATNSGFDPPGSPASRLLRKAMIRRESVSIENEGREKKKTGPEAGNEEEFITKPPKGFQAPHDAI